MHEAGYEFAIIRIGFRGYGQEGTLKEDERFKEYIDGAKETGLDVGVYIFSQAIDEEEAIVEAEFVIELLDGIELELPITFDPELIRDDEARTDDVTGEQFTKNTLAFCDHIRSKGYEPRVYSNMYWGPFCLIWKNWKTYRYGMRIMRRYRRRHIVLNIGSILKKEKWTVYRLRVI